jgi:hypothetical protein
MYLAGIVFYRFRARLSLKGVWILIASVGLAVAALLVAAVPGSGSLSGVGVGFPPLDPSSQLESIWGLFVWNLSVCLSCSATGDAVDRASCLAVEAFLHGNTSYDRLRVSQLASGGEVVFAECAAHRH